MTRYNGFDKTSSIGRVEIVHKENTFLVNLNTQTIAEFATRREARIYANYLLFEPRNGLDKIKDMVDALEKERQTSIAITELFRELADSKDAIERAEVQGRLSVQVDILRRTQEELKKLQSVKEGE